MFRSIAKRAALLALCLIVAGSSLTALAQSTYTYTGHPFTLFSCGPYFDTTLGMVTGTLDCSTPGPNANTSYTAADFVSATLTLSSPLPANMALADVSTLPGFALSMNDGQHTVTNLQQQGMFAKVGTDASGQINQWQLVINTGGTQNGGIATANEPGNVYDMGTLACCDPEPQGGNFGAIFSMPGSWNSGAPSPASAVSSLITMLNNPLLGLTPGQINSLTDKLNNALASIQAGLNKQAINQLNAFISAVQTALKNGKITPQAASTLTTAAQAIIAMLQ